MVVIAINVFLAAYIAGAVAHGWPGGRFPARWPRSFHVLTQTLGLPNRWFHFWTVPDCKSRLQIVTRNRLGLEVEVVLRPPATKWQAIDRLANHKLGKFEMAILNGAPAVVLQGLAQHVVMRLPQNDALDVVAVEFRRETTIVPSMSDPPTAGRREIEVLLTQAIDGQTVLGDIPKAG